MKTSSSCFDFRRRALFAALVLVSVIMDGSLFAQSAPTVAPAALPPTPTAPPANPPPPTSARIPPVPLPPGIPSAPNRAALDRPSVGQPGLPPGDLQEAIIAEETNVNPAAAIEKYRAIVAGFDAKRPDAAQAVFRLGECLRKLGRLEEAKAQYGRILREFVDHPDLARLSQKLLAEMPNAAGGLPSLSPPIAVRENDDFLRQDMELVREQIAQTQKLVQSGLATSSTLIPLKRELLRLEQQRVDPTNARQPSQHATIEVTPDRFARTFSAREEDLRAIETELRQQRLELQKLNNLRSLTSTNRPELLTPRLIDDKRYQQLKEEYEQRLNATSSPNAGEEEDKGLEASRRKIAKWMNEVYKPELEYSIEFAEQQIATLRKEANELESIVAEENAKNEAKAAKKHAEQLRAGATPRGQ